MLHAVGYHVTYRIGAFKTPAWHVARRQYNALPNQLRDALDLGAKAVPEKSDGDWLVVIKRCLQLFNSDDVAAKLVMFVPAGLSQGAQLLEAIAHFEAVIEERLGAPVDTTLRSIEEGGPKCETCGSHEIGWVRTTPYIGNERYFCYEDAKWEPDFGGNAATSPHAFLYVRQRPYGA